MVKYLYLWCSACVVHAHGGSCTLCPRKNVPSQHVLKSSKLASFAQLQFNSMNIWLVELLLGIIGLLFLSRTVEALQGKRCQDSLLSGGGRSDRAKISGGRGRPWRIFFGFYKPRHILLSVSANCTGWYLANFLSFTIISTYLII